MNEIVFTPAGLLDLLSQIDEFKDLDIGLAPTIDDKLQLQIGNSIYTIDNNAETVYVDNEVGSEEHTSELQSRFDLVCRLLLEKKKYRKIKK